MATDLQYNIVGEEAVRDPHGYFGRIRDNEPVVWDANSRSWLVTSYKHVTAALRDDKSFSSDRIMPFIRSKLSGPETDPLVRQAFEILADWLVFKDKPDHLRIRMLVNKAFSARSVAILHDRVGVICDELLGALPDDGQINLLEDFCLPLSATVISDMLGIPAEDRDKFEHWQRLIGPIVGAGLDDPSRYDKLARGMDELLTYCSGLLQHYREHPAPNLITELIEARENTQSLSEAEIISTCTLMLFGGSETTANLIANSIRALMLHPDQMAMMRAGKVTPQQAVEEFLRFDGSGKAVTRVVREDCDFFGHEFKKGQRVFLVLASANHDPEVFPNAGELQLDRVEGRKHIAFGYGLHVCMGSPLARLETGIAIPKILDRWSRIDFAGPLEWHAQLLARGLKSLPLEVHR
ncbi:MAG: cytochrome P450 [Sphingomonadaceae bacterium]